MAASCLIVVNLISVTSQDTTLHFLMAVAGVDVAKYNIQTIDSSDARLSGVADQTIKYRLESDGSKMEVIGNLRNGALVWCKIYRLQGSPILNVSSVDALDSAKSLMSRLQSVSKAPYLQPICDILSTLTELKSMTIETSNVKLEVYNDGNYSRFFWTGTVNGIEIPQKQMGLVFYNGTFESFGDYWNVYTVGNTDVKFDREKAIQVAKERAQNYSYTIGNTVVNNFTILEDYITAELTMQDRGNYVVYPWWEIRLPLDKVYLGSVTEIRVLMWADTGEVTYVQAIGGGGLNFNPQTHFLTNSHSVLLTFSQQKTNKTKTSRNAGKKKPCGSNIQFETKKHITQLPLWLKPETSFFGNFGFEHRTLLERRLPL